MDKEHIRWEQRFSNYRKALKKLSEAIEYVQENLNDEAFDSSETTEVLDEIIKEG